MELFVDAYVTGGCAICHPEAYHMVFLHIIIAAQHPICQLEALNALVALRQWVSRLRGKLVHLFSDSAIAVAIFYAWQFIHACT